MTALIKREKGQVLVISMAVIFLIFIFAVAAVEIGNLMYEKTHIQNIADSGAMEGGMWYARGMNMLALSNKVLAITGVAAVIASLTGAEEAGRKAVDMVQKAQDLIAGTGDIGKAGIKPMPLFCTGAVLLNGSDNKALSIPLCNLKDFDTGMWLPSFNVKRRYVEDTMETPQTDGSGGGAKNDDSHDKYYYRPKGSGEKVYVDKKYVRFNPNLRNKSKAILVNDPVHGNKLLVKEAGKESKGTVPLDIVESSQEHSVLVVSFRNDDRLGPITGIKFFKDDKGNVVKPAFLAAFSFVRISGGKLDILELDGANYEPRLEHIEFPKIEAAEGLAESAGQAAGQAQSGGNIGKMGGYLKDAINILNSGILLH